MKKLAILALLFVALLPKALAGSDRASCVSSIDVYWLAKNIYHEARGEGELGMTAVGIVTVNRSHNPDYPTTIKGVVTQRNQFSWYGDRKSDTIKDREAWFKSLTIAKEILNGNTKGLKLKNVYFYHARTVKPAWSKKLERAVVIGNHIFYRNNNG